MKKPIALVALACAGACTIPLALPLLAGAGLATAGAAWLNTELVICAGLALVAGGLLAFVLARRNPAGAEVKSCSIDGSCGCGPKLPTTTDR